MQLVRTASAIGNVSSFAIVDALVGRSAEFEVLAQVARDTSIRRKSVELAVECRALADRVKQLESMEEMLSRPDFRLVSALVGILRRLVQPLRSLRAKVFIAVRAWIGRKPKLRLARGDDNDAGFALIAHSSRAAALRPRPEQSVAIDDLPGVMTKRSLYKAWSDEDIERLREHIARGGSVARASVMFGRTKAAARAQAASLGLRFLTVRELRAQIARKT